MPPERRVLQPLDRAEEMDVPGDGLAVGPDEIDLGVVLTIPPSSDGVGLGPPVVGQQPQQGFTYDRLDGAPTPRRPGAFDGGQDAFAPPALDQWKAAIQEGEPEP